MLRSTGRLLAVLFFTAFGVVRPGNAQDMYATGDDGRSLIRINTETGVATRVGYSGYSQTWAGAFTADGVFLTILNGFSNGQLGRFDLESGAASAIGAAWGTTDVISLGTVGNSLFAAGFDGRFYGVDPFTGALSTIGNLGFFGIMDFATDRSGRLYGLAGNQFYSIDTETGASSLYLTLSGPGASGPMSAAFTVDDQLVVNSYSSPSSLYTVDRVTGQTTAVGANLGIAFAHGGDIYAGSVVPEPLSMVLLGTGLAGIAAARRRRRQHKEEEM